ncbi:MAG: phage tail tube protein [Dehalococcoidia bacterium]
MAAGTGQQTEISVSQESTWAGALTGGSTVDWPAFEDPEWGYNQSTSVIRNILSAASIKDVAFGLRYVEGRIRGVLDYSNQTIIWKNIFGSANASADGLISQFDFALRGSLPTGVQIDFRHTDLTHTYDLNGCKFNRMQLSMNAGEGLQYEFGFIGKDAGYTASVAGSSAQADEELITSDDFGFSIFGDTSVCVNSFTLTLDQPLNTDQACIGSTLTLTNEPGRSDQRTITMEFEIEFEDSAHWTDFVNKTVGVISMGSIGETARSGGSTHNRFALYAPRCRVLGWSLPIGGPGRILQRVSMQALQNTTAGDELTLQIKNSHSRTV